ncbi:MAG: Lysophospholipase 1 [Geoglossum simile]|nr:MAG: Lysophospholipase 1 [Geoglossum simile]
MNLIGLVICPLLITYAAFHVYGTEAPLSPFEVGAALVGKRALPNAPSGYTPRGGDCLSDRPTIRSAKYLSPNETSWLELRRNNTFDPMRSLLKRLNITGFNISNLAQNGSELPNIAIAFSGGGWRALMNGAGALQAFDSRTGNSTSVGQLGGLLEATTYLVGLSGGSWLVGSVAVTNFSSVSSILNGTSGPLWEFSNSILKGPEQIDTTEYYNEIYSNITGKNDAGFNISITDYWGRALSYQMINATDGGPSFTWSSISLGPQFSSGSVPMPIIVADGRAPGELLIPTNTTVYEFNPWELGSFDPTVYGFAPLEFIGSNFSGGTLPSNESCVRGFDNAGFVMGTSSSLFNQFFLQINNTNIPPAVKNSLTKILSNIGEANNDIADYTPNPFYHYNNATNVNAGSKRLTLVDGGEDLQNIPLQPLIEPARHVDVIFAIDSSADTEYNWPNGTSLVATYQRSLNASGIGNGTAFPAIPDQNTFINKGLNTRPTFFGCNASNTTSITPLVVYIPNAPYTYQSNVSTFTLTYSNSVRDEIIRNGYNVATMGNGSVDAQWPSCVGCAIVSRSLERTGTAVPATCQQCFQKYCWDGTLNSTPPATYSPQNLLSGAIAKQKLGMAWMLVLSTMVVWIII